jgi:hypothetical protein
MKKAVFLFLFLGFFISPKGVNASMNDRIFEFPEYEFRLTYFAREDRSRGYHLEKLGSNPFAFDLIYEDTWIIINGIEEINGNHVFYGNIHVFGEETFYDTFILVLSSSGAEIYKQVIDYGDLESVYNVVEIDNLILVHSKGFYESEMEEIEFEVNYFTTYDYDFNMIDEIETYENYKFVDNTDRLYLFSLDYDEEIEGALTSDLNIIRQFDSLVIASNEVFTNSITIDFLNSAVLNDEVIYNGIIINYPGNYSLLYNDFLYEFQVVPEVTGIEDDAIYNNPVTPLISSGNIYLNNDLYISGTEISAPGNYTLQIMGTNGYLEEYDFTITSNMSGILHNQTYSEPVEIVFSGNAYLNNSYIESPYVISEDGEYILKMQGENNYLETFYFNIEKPEEETSLISFVQKFDVVFLGVVVIGGGLILKKK